jgi:hypothetical protein
VPGAQRIVGTPSSQWDLHAWHSCHADTEAWSFPDRNAAALWLKPFKSNPVSMAALRSVMVQLGHSASPRHNGDDKLLEEAAWLLSKGVLHVHKMPARRTAWNTGQKEPEFDTAPVSPRPAASRPASAPAKVAEEPDTFSSQTDGVATAAVLRSAAADGVPFCEQCAKSAAARRAA